MIKTGKRLLSALLAVMSVCFVSAESLKREFRSAWIATVANIDWPKSVGSSSTVVASQKADLISYLDAMEEMNLTTVCFQVRSMCDAMYKSSYEPWSSYLTGKRGTDPGWDPLAFVVEECHRRGIECYAWVNPYRWSSTGTTSTWNTDFDTQVKNDNWLITNGTFTVLNPGLDETRAHIVKVCKEIISNYGVEGLIFDDYFYPVGGTAEDSTAPDYDLWKNSGITLSIGDWRRENVDKMVSDVYAMVQETRPEVRFGIAPPGTAGASAGKYGLSIWTNGYDTQYTSLYSDPLSWMSKGIVDFVSPQIYWHNDHSMAPFGEISNWWYSLAAHFKNCHCNVSVNVYDLVQAMGYQEDLGNTQAHWNEHVENVLQSRSYAADNGLNAFGSNFYSIQYLVNRYAQHGKYIAEKCFGAKALVPVVDWKTAPEYGAVQNLDYNDGILSWTATSAGMSTMRYTVYAVPRSVSKAEVETSDGYDSQYLLGVTYAAEYSLPSDKLSGYWYAVCVYDGYGNEHQVSVLNYPEGNYLQKAELVTPENDAEVDNDIFFSWTASDVNTTTFTLQVSTDDTFSVMSYTEDIAGGETSTTVPAYKIGLGTFYWRVVSKSDDSFDTPSDSRKFIITDAGVGNFEDGYVVRTDNDVYDEVGDVAVESLWLRSIRDEYDNFSSNNSSLNRSMVAVGDFVYVSGRQENSPNATAYLDKYNGKTGEYLARLTLGNAVSVGYFPCNNVVKDSYGNVCVSNLCMMQNYPLKIHLVNLETGDVTPVTEISSVKQPGGRFDYVSITGDVTTGNFTVYGVASNTANILRWKYVDWVCSETMVSVSEYYPVSKSSFGIAPRVIPVADDDLLIDCAGTAITRYNFESGECTGSFLENSGLAPASMQNNGGTFFTLGDKTIVVYAYDDFSASPANTFNVVETSLDIDFSEMNGLWVLPARGLGSENNASFQAIADYVRLEDSRVRLYLYVPGNGLCAYEIYDTGFSGIEEVLAPVDFGIEYYNMQGVKVNGEKLVPGVYIKRHGNDMKKVVVK